MKTPSSSSVQKEKQKKLKLWNFLSIPIPHQLGSLWLTLFAAVPARIETKTVCCRNAVVVYHLTSCVGPPTQLKHQIDVRRRVGLGAKRHGQSPDMETNSWRMRSALQAP
jgi:hypothetical protein